MDTLLPILKERRMPDHSQRLHKLRMDLQFKGWRAEDLLEDATASTEYAVDLALCHNLYPLALLTVGAAELAEALPGLLAEFPDLRLAYLTDGERVWEAEQGQGAPREIEGLPTQAEVLDRIGSTPTAGDPRFAPAPDTKRPPSLNQLIAVKRILDSIQAGEERGHVVLPTGSGKTIIITYAIAKLLRSTGAEQIVYVTERRSSFEQLQASLRDAGIGSGELGKDSSQVLLAIPADVRKQAKQKPGAPPDFTILDVVTPEREYIEAVSALKPRYLLGIAQFVRDGGTVRNLGRLLYEASLQEAFAEAEREPPSGYESAQLREIASVKFGPIRSIARKSNSAAVKDGLYVVTGSDLQSDGTIDVSSLGVLPKTEVLQELGLAELPADALLQPADIITSSWVAVDGSTKVARVPDALPGDTVFTNRLIRLRPSSPELGTSLYTFLRSDIGQRQLRRYRDKTRISAADLHQLTVFLPTDVPPVEPAAEAPPVPEALGVIAELLRQIEGSIIPGLKNLQAQAHEPGIEAQYIPIGNQLAELAGHLLPRPLENIVLETYPTPIAVAFRHYRESRFNSYQQVLRLRDVFESIAFFIYHVVLADAVANLPHATYGLVPNNYRDAREAYDSFSTAHRMTFVNLILERAAPNHGTDLFMPELLQGRIVECIKVLQSDFRNVLSHTATPNDRQIKRIIDEYWPVARELLESTRFLSDYRMLRIPSFYYKNRVRRATTELYRGAVPQISEEELDISIDQDHLILVNNEQEYLDLYPLYRLLDTTFSIDGVDKKRDETHLAVFKYRKKKEHKLQYESINGGFELSDTAALHDFDAFVGPLKPATGAS